MAKKQNAVLPTLQKTVNLDFSPELLTQTKAQTTQLLIIIFHDKSKFW
jgi:hypothetical protein